MSPRPGKAGDGFLVSRYLLLAARGNEGDRHEGGPATTLRGRKLREADHTLMDKMGFGAARKDAEALLRAQVWALSSMDSQRPDTIALARTLVGVRSLQELPKILRTEAGAACALGVARQLSPSILPQPTVEQLDAAKGDIIGRFEGHLLFSALLAELEGRDVVTIAGEVDIERMTASPSTDILTLPVSEAFVYAVDAQLVRPQGTLRQRGIKFGDERPAIFRSIGEAQAFVKGLNYLLTGEHFGPQPFRLVRPGEMLRHLEAVAQDRATGDVRLPSKDGQLAFEIVDADQYEPDEMREEAGRRPLVPNGVWRIGWKSSEKAPRTETASARQERIFVIKEASANSDGAVLRLATTVPLQEIIEAARARDRRGGLVATQPWGTYWSGTDQAAALWTEGGALGFLGIGTSFPVGPGSARKSLSSDPVFRGDGEDEQQ